MRKIFLVLSLASIVGLTATARTLSPSEALKRVGGASRAMSDVTPVMTVGSAEAPAIYVFNRPEGGWMVVSADDVAAPLIGYGTEGTLDAANLPDNFKGWLDLCGEDISRASAAGAAAYKAVRSRAASREAIGPLIQTHWNQSTPYNKYCPSYTFTGCVATSMAQIMNYHKWPETAGDNANFSYKYEGGTLSEDFSNYRFDWDNMTNEYDYAMDTPQAEAVAKLMQACGYSLRMRYSRYGSAAYNEDVSAALITYFKYDAGMHNEYRSFNLAEDWENMIYSNLEEYGPMVYWGGAHSFICDGYQDGYFHFNWGWGGMSDGYFLFSYLSPSDSGIGGDPSNNYTNNQGALLGIKPAGDTPSEHRYTFCIDEMSSVLNQGTYLRIYGSFVNRSPFIPTGGKIIYQVFSEDGSKRVATGTMYSPASIDTWGVDITTGNTVTVPQLWGAVSGVPAGKYRVYPAVSINGKEYPMQCPPTIAGYVMIEHDGSQITKAEIPSAGEMVIENLSTHGDFYESSSFKISGTAKFTGRGEVSTAVYAILRRADTSVRGNVQNQISLSFSPEGTDFEFVSDWFYDKLATIEEGEYTFALAKYEGGVYTDIAGGSCPVTVKSRVPVGSFENPIGLTVDNADAVDPSDIRVNAAIKGTAGVVYQDMTFTLFKDMQTVTQKTVPVYVSAGQTESYLINFSIADAAVGDRYSVAATVNKGGKYEYVSSQVFFNIGEKSGISDVEVDENVPAEYFNLQGVRVNADQLVPGIYICRKGNNVTKVLIR